MHTNQIVPVEVWGMFSMKRTIELEVIPKSHLGVINQNAVAAFNRGQCHSLAYAINKDTGWPILGIGDSNSSPNHCVVYNPNIDDYIDISGPGSLGRGMHSDWAYEMIREILPAEIETGLPYYLPLNFEAAYPFAKAVLKKVHKLPKIKTVAVKSWMNGNKPVEGFVDKSMGEVLGSLEFAKFANMLKNLSSYSE